MTKERRYIRKKTISVKAKYLYLFIWVFLLALSCKQTTISKLDKILELSGNNKNEIVMVLKHYNKPSDSLKRKAAIFLIENMRHKKSFRSGFLKDNKVFFDKIKSVWNNPTIEASDKEERFNILFDSLEMGNSNSAPQSNSNLKQISSSYLIDNIDLAFMAWETYPWSADVNFEDFCNYILPYRVFDEPVEEWRKELMNRYRWVLDSIKNPKSLREATILINNSFNETMTYCAPMKKIPNILGFSALDSLKMGKCDHLVTLNTYCLRAMGIPSKVEMAQWADHRGGHTWCSIEDENGALFVFDPLYTQENISDTLKQKVIFNDIPEYQITKRKTAKVERYTYKNQYENILEFRNAKKNNNNKNSSLIGLNSLDVTSDYSSPNATFELEFQDNQEEGVLYLSVQNGNVWKKVTWSIKSPNGLYKFENMGSGIVYLPTLINESSGLSKKFKPFILNDNGTIKFLDANRNKRRVIKVDRKYFKRHYVDEALDKMVGGVFQGANHEDFRDARDLYKIISTPKPKTNHFNISSNDRFRYVRFVTKKNLCRVAEMKFFGRLNLLDSVPVKELSGKLISGGAKKNNDSPRILDNDVLTYFVSNVEEGGWVGFDFGKKNEVYIESVNFYPPNDGNSIEIGDSYELFYWDDEWVSLGAHVAREEELTFMNCPENALFILKNNTKGADVRIFTYENNKQIWW